MAIFNSFLYVHQRVKINHSHSFGPMKNRSSQQAPRPPRQAPEDQLAISAAVQGALHADPGLGPVEGGEDGVIVGLMM